jgi:hypothetical protein
MGYVPVLLTQCPISLVRGLMRRFAVPAALASTLALAAGLIVVPASATAVAPSPTESSTGIAATSPHATPTVTPAPRIDFAGLAKAAVGAALDIYKCQPFTEKGLTCEKKPTIKDVMNRLDEIERQITRNQRETMQALDALQGAIDGQDLTKAVKDLAPLTAHIGEAGKAWDALSICTDKAVSPKARCTGYAGVPLEDVPVAEGIKESTEFFLGQMDKIRLTLEETTQFFAGVEGQPGVGLLHNLWKVAKREQDRASGASSPAQLPLQPVVVTHQLAQHFLPTMTYYRDLVYVYGALRPAAQALKGKESQARSEAALADKNIFSNAGRWSVTGAFSYYRIPDVPPGTFAYVGGDGKLYKIAPDAGKGSHLTAGVVMEIGDRLKKYGYDADVMARSGKLLPHNGRFGGWEKVKHRNFPEYSYGAYAICAGVGGFGCPGTPGVGTRKETFEIGHPDPVESKDGYGNIMKMRWVPMQILNDKATWSKLVNGELNLGGYCFGDLRGEPPYGVWEVRFLETFRRTVENRHAMFEWDWVGYGDRVRKCVGPGVYVSQNAASPFSVVDKGTPAGVLVK